MHKNDLLKQMQNCRNNLLFSLAAATVISTEESHEILNKSSANFGGFQFDCSQIPAILGNAQDRQIFIQEFVNHAFRALLKESFELVKVYSNSTSQFRKFQSFSSYYLHRLLRNAVSHDFIWDLKNTNGNFYHYLPLTWKDVEVTAQHHGTPVVLEHITYAHMWAISEETLSLADKTLN